MTGLDKILNQIAEEASSVAQQTIKAAEVQAESIAADAREEAGRQEKLILEKSQVDCSRYQERMKSRADFQKRTAVLEAKQEIITQVIEKAYRQMCDAKEEQYFSYLERMLETFALPQDGEILFSAKDRKRMPSGFPEKIREAAAKKGGSLNVSDKEADIEGGFVLVYGGIEENCTFRALFDAKREQLQDRASTFLFSK